MRTYEDRAKDFIKEVFPFIESMNVWTIRDEIQIYNRANSRKVKVSNGCARIALITSDYVVKFDYDEYEVESIGGCENEIKLYAIAEAEGFAYMFAKITRYEYKGRKFYIMPRVRGIDPDGWWHADHYMNDEERDFCDRHYITDLHCGNFGFRKGRVCIVDYACRRWDNSDTMTSSEESDWT